MKVLCIRLIIPIFILLVASGAEAKDASENGNHGTLEGDAKFVDVGAPISPLAMESAGTLVTTWVEIKQE